MSLRVNGEEIKESDIREEMERLRPEYERVFQDMDSLLREAQLLEWARENVIERVLIQQEALNDSEEIPEQQVNASLKELKKQHGGEQKFFEKFDLSKDDEPILKEDLKLQLKVERIIERVREAVPEPTEEEIEQYYEEHPDDFMAPEQVRAAHIVKHLRDKQKAEQALQEAREEIDAGGEFIDVAKKYSDCPPDEVDLGYFPRGRMVEPFEDVAFNLEPGEISGVFRTEFGFHITRVYDRKPPQKYPLEQVRGQIEKELHEERKKEAVEQFIDELKQKASIEDN